MSFPRFWAEDIGVDRRQVRLQRVIPLRIYVAEFSHDLLDSLSRAAEAVCKALDLEVAADFPGEKASWYKTWFARTKEAATEPEVAARLKKLEKAIEVKALGMPQAEIDHLHAESAAILINALPKDVPAAMQIGSILVVYVPTKGLATRTLSAGELIQLEQNQDVLKDPTTALDRLAQLCGGHHESDEVKFDTDPSRLQVGALLEAFEPTAADRLLHRFLPPTREANEQLLA